MKLVDIMVPAEGIAFPKTLKGEQDALALTDLANLPQLIGVTNQDGQVLGFVDRDILTFLNRSCENWILGQIADKFQEGVIAIDADSRIFYVNDIYSRIIGVSKHNVLGKCMKEIEPGAAILSVLESGEPILNKAVHIKTVNLHVVVNIYPIKRDGKLIAVVSIFRDVTETKQLNKALDKAHGLVEYFRQQLTGQDDLEKNNIIGTHPSFLAATSKAILVAKTDASILLREIFL